MSRGRASHHLAALAGIVALVLSLSGGVGAQNEQADEEAVEKAAEKAVRGGIGAQNEKAADRPSEKPAEKTSTGTFVNAFFAMNTGTKDAKHQTAGSQVDMLAELGYAGIGYVGYEHVGEMLAELDRVKLKMVNNYLVMSIDSGEVDRRFEPLLRQLKGRETVIWLALTSAKWKPSSPAGDEAGVKLVREVATLAAKADLKIALYPHAHFWVERVEDALRVVEKTERSNVGVTFNLCHFLKVEGDRDPKPVLKRALPHLWMVSINGADRGDTRKMGWDRLIQTLDRGSYDVAGLVVALRDIGYKGPIGLQGYGIGGDVHDNLSRSMAAWRRMTAPRPR